MYTIFTFVVPICYEQNRCAEVIIFEVLAHEHYPRTQHRWLPICSSLLIYFCNYKFKGGGEFIEVFFELIYPLSASYLVPVLNFFVPSFPALRNMSYRPEESQGGRYVTVFR